MNNIDLKTLNIQPFGQLNYDYIGYQSLTDIPRALSYMEEDCDYSMFSNKSTVQIVEALRLMESLQGQAHLLGIIQSREGTNFSIDNKSGIIICHHPCCLIIKHL